MSVTQLASLLEPLGIPLSTVTPFIQYDTGSSYLFSSEGKEALPIWYRLRLAAPTTGFWPVLLGDTTALGDHQYRLDTYRHTTESNHIAVTPLITKSLLSDPLHWFRARVKSVNGFYHALSLQDEPEFSATEVRKLQVSEPIWALASDPYLPEPNVFTIPTETIYPRADDPEPVLRMQAASTVYLALLPTTTAWHIPAYLVYDAWNDAPAIDGQLVVWRWWQTYQQVEIVGIAQNKIEAWVTVPPSTPNEVERLAWEQRVYCSDRSDLTDDLPAYLRDSTVWTFWWH